MGAIIGGFAGLILMAGMIVLLVRGVRVRKEIPCAAGQWTTVISNFGTGTPAEWTLTFETADGQPVRGTYREQRALWIFPQSPETGPLQSQMVFSRKWINAKYSLKVQPETDVTIRIS